ncbi:glycosyltransferase [Kaistella flava (ex Peng et al. 2021)]|uniref:Glycosyltransferase n=1 Tax=Kaistella flava (ex Peng et al. 2021) TaxID=2038776 RepID=A0A7M2Y8P4_9FLAO|nr:glycosyltransferase [Kaistella flava (ex Peng et al. 2021)]QOW10627.1 glycosyltransferase [Kaistella flava (ex Peng et al. 2021)]
MPKNLLFITWDGPQTNYMEGLFMPIFQEIAKTENINFHVIQFTWADEARIDAIKTSALEMGIHYTAFPILKKPIASLGSLLTLFTSSKKIASYIQKHEIDIVVPRSTFPAFMVNQIKDRNFKIIFDADGLPLEERVDFAGLKKESRQYQWLKGIEQKMLLRADVVVTRSQKAIDIHLQTIGEPFKDKFSVVFNGRDASQFSINSNDRVKIRKYLAISDEEILMIYCGSLGPQYGLDEMLRIFRVFRQKQPAQFLILTGNTEFAKTQLKEQTEDIIIKKVNIDQIPGYLNAADAAFAFRQPAYSMQGVAPIKLGEYLLTGLPVVASKGIGDTENILHHFESCYLYDHQIGLQKQLPEIIKLITEAKRTDREKTRSQALAYFSLESAADSYIKAIKKLKIE